MIYILIDVHCHANLFLTIDKVIENAKKVGVEKIVAVAMSSISQERVLEIAKKNSEVYASLGIHPEEVKMNEKIEQQLDSIIDLIKQNKQSICAIGEIGLDHHFVKDKKLYPLQKTIFNKMLLLAQDLELPVNLHTKGAEKIVFDTLLSYKIPNVNIHWYSGPENFLKLGMDRGYYFSITPAISYSPVVKKVVLNVDKEHLLLESDGPVKYSGKIGVPALIKNVLNSISTLKEINLDELEKQIEENTRKIFPKIF
ncbi:MAG: TatD family deoxyribonuclease [Promethearchaeota archaeon]|nr:MAG: TatD family deoxyribonuclease [Candidatus Lokiarchaeota archaeon]